MVTGGAPNDVRPIDVLLDHASVLETVAWSNLRSISRKMQIHTYLRDVRR